MKLLQATLALCLAATIAAESSLTDHILQALDITPNMDPEDISMKLFELGGNLMDALDDVVEIAENFDRAELQDRLDEVQAYFLTALDRIDGLSRDQILQGATATFDLGKQWVIALVEDFGLDTADPELADLRDMLDNAVQSGMTQFLAEADALEDADLREMVKDTLTELADTLGSLAAYLQMADVQLTASVVDGVQRFLTAQLPTILAGVDYSQLRDAAEPFIAMLQGLAEID